MFPEPGSMSSGSCGDPAVRRILLWLVGTLTVVVLLFSYHTSTSSRMLPSQRTFAVGTEGREGLALARSGPVDGDVITTRFGAVQVRIMVEDGRIAQAEALQVPVRDRRDQIINARAVPILASQTVERQSAQLDAVSGATLTSMGYMQSLQSAIDKASA